jgi:hypothetical protein
MVDDITHLRQRLEYFERHIQTRNQEVKNEYNQALSKVLEAERPFIVLLVFSIIVLDRLCHHIHQKLFVGKGNMICLYVN